MPICAAHRQSCVLYCEECSEFICACCIESKQHFEHVSRCCRVEEGVTFLRAQSDSSLRRLRDMRAQTTSSVTQQERARAASPAAARQEGRLLDLFSAVESVLAAFKEECVRKFWAQKRHAESEMTTTAPDGSPNGSVATMLRGPRIQHARASQSLESLC